MQTDTFWNDIYRKGTQGTSGKPGLALAQFAGALSPGTALELGCAKGDDAVWLARQGGQVTAVDVSSAALSLAARNAATTGVADRMPETTCFSTAEDTFAAVRLATNAWQRRCLCLIARTATDVAGVEQVDRRRSSMERRTCGWSGR